MDEKTLRDLDVALGEEYDFKIRQTRWLGHIRWSAKASDPGYRIPAQIAVISLVLGVVSIGLGLACMSGCGGSAKAPLPTRDLFEMKARCAELGRNYDKELAKDINSNLQSIGRSRSAYNEKLNTCLYSGQIHSLSGNPSEARTTQRFIVDLLTGKELTDSNDPQEFARREAELLGPR